MEAKRRAISEAVRDVVIEVENIPLSSLFSQGLAIHETLQTTSLGSMDVEYQVQCRRMYLFFHACGHSVRRLGVFSPNEDIDDINTSDLKYLLVPYYLAVAEGLTIDDHDREEHLQSQVRYLLGFLGKAERLGLVHKDDLASFHLEDEERVKRPPAREEKIARARREKEAQTKLNELVKKRQQVAGKKNSNNNNVDVDEIEDGSIDTELERSHSLLLIDLCIRKAVDEYDMVVREMYMLEQVRRSGGKESFFAAASSSSSSSSSKKPLKAITITSDKGQLRAKVFKPSHALPTMTLDEWFEEQVALGILPDPVEHERNEREKAIAAKKDRVKVTNNDVDEIIRRNKQKQAGEEDDDDDDDDGDEAKEEQKRQKASKWDDWKDWHPRGAGNMYRRG
jgi:immunoglobulin-binding protein 1